MKGVVLGLAAMVVAGCSEVTLEDFALPEGSTPPITMDAEVYTLARVPGGYEASALATYRNLSDRIVSFERCTAEWRGPIYLARRTGPDSTRPAFVTGIPACVGGVPPGRVYPGAAIVVPVTFVSLDSPSSTPPITPDQRMGRFRLELGLCTDAVAGVRCEPIPQSARQSAPFEIRLPSSGSD